MVPPFVHHEQTVGGNSGQTRCGLGVNRQRLLAEDGDLEREHSVQHVGMAARRGRDDEPVKSRQGLDLGDDNRRAALFGTRMALR